MTCEFVPDWARNLFPPNMTRLSQTVHYVHHPLPAAELNGWGEMRQVRQVVIHEGKLHPPTCSTHLPPSCFYVLLSTLRPSFSHLISCSLAPTVRQIHRLCQHLCNVPSLPPSPSYFSGEVNTISLATAGWGVLSSQVQGDGRLGRLPSTHLVFTGCYWALMNTKLQWTWGV